MSVPRRIVPSRAWTDRPPNLPCNASVPPYLLPVEQVGDLRPGDPALLQGLPQPCQDAVLPAIERLLVEPERAGDVGELHPLEDAEADHQEVVARHRGERLLERGRDPAPRRP